MSSSSNSKTTINIKITEITITSGNSQGKFAIDVSSGEITVADALDYESTTQYSLTVLVSDGFNSSSGIGFPVTAQITWVPGTRT